MYYQRNISQKNINIFNNYDCLLKEELTLLTYKTVLNLPLNKVEIKKIDKIKGKVECDCPAKYLIPKMVSGNIQINLSYRSLGSEKKENIFFALPFKAPLFSKCLEKIEGSLKYITARKVGERNIIIEAVAALEGKGESLFRESMQREGNLINSATFRVNISFPDILKILASQQKIIIMEYQQIENHLEIKGIKQMDLLYIGKTMAGEHVIRDGKVEPFFERINLDNQTNRLIKGVEIFEDNLSAVQLNQREIQLVGTYGIKVIYASELMNPEQDVNPFMEKALEAVPEECIEKKDPVIADIGQDNEVEKIDEIPELIVENKDEEENIEKVAIIKRESKRAKLLKHKRELHNLS